MKYTITFNVIPTGDFGLPQEGYVVVPTDVGPIHGPSLDPATGQLVGYGTLSVFRKEADGISMAFPLGDSRIEIIDANVFCHVDAPGWMEAFRTAMNEVGHFLRLLAAYRGMFYWARPVSNVDADLKSFRVPDPIGLGSYKIYDLDGLRTALSNAAGMVRLQDERLAKAILYLQNALLLQDAFYGRATPLSTIDFNVVALLVLELWKTCAAIMGDPSIKRDRYQKRYKTIGISTQTKDAVDKLGRLRNGFDVAHYSLDSGKRIALEQELKFAFQTAGAVIKEYVSYLEPREAHDNDESEST
jgi:hypothetical protein